MSGQSATAVYLGPNPGAFQVLLRQINGCDGVQVIPAASEKELGEVLSSHPRAAAIIEYGRESLFRRIRKRFSEAVIVGFVDRGTLADKLFTMGLFDIVAGSEPGWRLLLAVRNATNLSALLEANCNLNGAVVESERMLTATAGAAGLVHDAGNRLYAVENVLLLTAQNVQSLGKTKSAQGFGETLRDAAGEINGVVSRLKEILSSEPAAFLRKSRGVQVDGIARRVTELMASSFGLAGVTLERYIDIEVPAICASAAGIASVIIELLRNALKACSAGDSVRLKVVRDGNDILLEVSDTAGCKKAPRATKPAAGRLSRNTGKKSTGGLGLSLVRRVVQAHGAKIESDSVQGKGSTFSLRMPVSYRKGAESFSVSQHRGGS